MSDTFDPDDIPSDPVEAAVWFEENAASLTEEELEVVYDQFHFNAQSGGMGSPDMAAWSALASTAQVAIEEGVQAGQDELESSAASGPISNVMEAAQGEDGTEPVAVGTAIGAAFEQAQQNEARSDALREAIDVAADIWGRTAQGVRPNLSPLDEFVDRLDFLTPGQAQAFLREAMEGGFAQARDDRAGEIQGQTGASDDEAQALAEGQMSSMSLFDAAEPDWLLQLNQGMLSDQQKERYLDYWNDAYGTTLTDFDTQLAPILARFDGTEAEAQNFAAAVISAQEPQIATTIDIPLVGGTKKVTYTQDELDDLRAMGYSNDAITRLVRLAGITAGADAIRPGAVGDTLNIAPLAALTRYYGAGSEFARFNQLGQDINQLESAMGLQPGEFRNMTYKERLALKERWQAVVDGLPASERRGDPSAARLEAWDQAEQLLRTEGRLENHGDLPGVLSANNNFRRGMERYRGDQLLAIVYAVDPTLAENVAASGGDPDKLSWQDNAAVYDILERSGVIEGSNVRLRQLESSTGFFGYFSQGRGSQGGGGAGAVRRLVDPAAVREQVQQLWSRMFLADVDDATVQAVTANLQKQLDEAPDGMSFDVSSRIMAFLRGRDVYDELYRNKPEGLSEEEYQAQFAAGVQDMLGNELDPEALKSGMRTGDYQTAVGRAGASAKLLTNSTLRGRWAQAKQTLDQFT